VSVCRPNYASRSTPSSTTSFPSSSVEIESIENIIGDNEEDISVSSKSSSAPFSFPPPPPYPKSTASTSRDEEKFSANIFKFSESMKNSLHTKRITGMKILKGEKARLVVCGMDKKLVCVDVESGKVKYTTVLDGIPLCMSVDDSDGYIVLGLLDGRVQFFSSKSGTKIMEFIAHKKKVRIIYQDFISFIIIFFCCFFL
jgi:hypothetical protein